MSLEHLGSTRIAARVVPGHRVASGQNGNPLFPGGTLRMQAPHFLALGLDLSRYHGGTLNVSIAPFRYRVLQPCLTLPQVKWHPTEPAEDFSFFEVCLLREGHPPLEGLVYYPHPETKPTHFQQPDVLELLLPWADGMKYDNMVHLEFPLGQLAFDPEPGAP